jgi:xylulokinase
MLVAGVDTSTQATKVLIVDPADGEVVATGRALHEVTGAGGARETDPEVWWEALRLALAECDRAEEVDAISIAGQQHGLVTLDRDRRPLRPAILWNDTRSEAEARELTEALGGGAEWAERVGLVPVPSFTATRWAWLRRHEPDRAAAARAVRLPHDFITERLCDRGATDRGDASGTAWWSTRDEGYADEVLDLIGLDRALLPEVLGPRDAAGDVTPAAARALGLRAGALVGPGTGDNMGAALGLGARPGEPVVSLGTSGTAYAVMEKRAADPSGTVAGFADASGRFLPLTATLNATLAVDRVAVWLGLDREAAAERSTAVVLPYLDGERTPNLPRAAGMIAGLRHATTREEILLAAYEGAAASLVEALDLLADQGSGLDPDAAILLVGGGARGRVWQRTVARLSGRPVQVPDADELVALGAAAQAAACLAGHPPEDVARRWDARHGITIEPPPERDLETLERIRATREATLPLHEGQTGGPGRG